MTDITSDSDETGPDDTSAALERFIQHAEKLPTLPTVINKLIDAVNEPDVSAEELGSLLQSDSTLSARLLKVANSVFYGMSGNVTTVTRAVIVLGYKTIRSLALAIWTQSFRDRVRSSWEQDAQERMFTHSLTAAVAASLVAPRVGAPELKEDCFLAGLLHDIGRVALISETGEWYRDAVMDRAFKQRNPIELEREAWGFDHAELGARLLESFHLPAIHIEATAGHHRPVEDPMAEPARACVVVANNLVKGLNLSFYDGPAVPPLDHLLTEIGLGSARDQQALATECVEGAQQLLSELL
jgi:putative nucleotidyltransferase with HDIG domain